jgi:sugar phosphate permease
MLEIQDSLDEGKSTIWNITSGKKPKRNDVFESDQAAHSLLFVCYFVAYLDRVNVSFAKLGMLDDLKLSDTVYGLGSGSFSSAISFSKCRATSSCIGRALESGSPAS